MARSEVRARMVSAATMPPMECPIRMVWTEGSTVGEGVWRETSISITFSRSLESSQYLIVLRDLYERGLPVSEVAHTFCEVASSLELGVYDGLYFDFGKCMADQSS